MIVLQVATSMGYYWDEDGWDEKALTDAGFPISLLPKVYLVFLDCVFGIRGGVLGIWHDILNILGLCMYLVILSYADG